MRVRIRVRVRVRVRVKVGDRVRGRVRGRVRVRVRSFAPCGDKSTRVRFLSFSYSLIIGFILFPANEIHRHWQGIK